MKRLLILLLVMICFTGCISETTPHSYSTYTLETGIIITIIHGHPTETRGDWIIIMELPNGIKLHYSWFEYDLNNG